MLARPQTGLPRTADCDKLLTSHLDLCARTRCTISMRSCTSCIMHLATRGHFKFTIWELCDRGRRLVILWRKENSLIQHSMFEFQNLTALACNCFYLFLLRSLDLCASELCVFSAFYFCNIFPSTREGKARVDT